MITNLVAMLPATNLIASIVVGFCTNVTERFPTHPVYEYPQHFNPNLLGHYNYHGTILTVPDANPTKKWVKTTVTRETTLVWMWEDKAFTYPMKSEPVSETEVEFSLERVEKWKPVATYYIPTAREERFTNRLGSATNYFPVMTITNLNVTNLPASEMKP